MRSRRGVKPKRWYERTPVTLCVAAGLVVIGFGFIHVITGVTSPYQLPFDIVVKESFGYQETLVDAKRIQALPYSIATRRYPLGVRVLQRRDYMPAGLAFEAKMATEQREEMQRWQAEFDRATGQPESRWQDRLRQGEQASARDAEDAQACNVRGVALARQGEYQAALAEFSRAIRREPTTADAFYNRALVYFAIGNLGSAASDLGKVVEIRPDFVEAHISRARLYAAMNKHDQAISNLTNAIQINPCCVKAYFQRGLVYYAKGDYGKAWDDVREIQSLGVQAPSGFVETLRAALKGD